MKFTEIETKYDAGSIHIDDFKAAVLMNPIRKHLLVSSYDDYFVRKKEFVRYRHTPNGGELTIKKKMPGSKSNLKRIEVNIPTEGDNLEAVSAFLNLQGYEYNFGIYKTCDIYWTGKVDFVYYVVYDKNFKELRRFIEIEADESFDWASEDEAWEEVVRYEKMLEPLGITPKHRLRKSLFETFRRP